MYLKLHRIQSSFETLILFSFFYIIVINLRIIARLIQCIYEEFYHSRRFNIVANFLLYISNSIIEYFIFDGSERDDCCFILEISVHTYI